MGCYIAGGIVTGLFLIFSLSVWRKYRLIASAPHLRELAEKLARIKKEAVAGIGKPLCRPSPAQLPSGALVTSAGIVVHYSIVHDADHFVHELALTHRDGWINEFHARMLVAFIHRLLALGTTPLRLGQSDTGRYYMSFSLDPDEQESFADRPVAVPALDEMKQLSRQCQQQAEQIDFETFSVPRKSA
jgi:hypothetical protein